MPLQLCLRTPIDDVIDALVGAARGCAPALSEPACRELVTLIFACRLRQTTSCGLYRECGGDADAPRPSGWRDPDPGALPAMFAAATVDRLEPRPPAADRAALEQELAGAFRAILAPLLHENPHCGTSPICDAPPTSPLERKRG